MAYAGEAASGHAVLPHPAAVFLVAGPFPAFRNVEPRTRDTRRAMVDKEALEKQRLAARTGGFHKYEYVPTALLTSAVENAPGYQGEAGRFDKDAAAEDRRQREQRRAQYLTRMEQRRAEAITREEQRWERIEAERRAEEERVAYLRANALKGKSNEGSVPYDPITLHFNDGKDGERLRAQDEGVRYRAALRARHLQERNMAEPFNPVTGVPVYIVPQPAGPPASVR